MGPPVSVCLFFIEKKKCFGLPLFCEKKSSACCLCLLKRLFRLALVLPLAKRRRTHRVSLLEHISVRLSLSVQLFESVNGTVLHDEFHRVSIDAGKKKKKREREKENIVSGGPQWWCVCWLAGGPADAQRGGDRGWLHEDLGCGAAGGWLQTGGHRPHPLLLVHWPGG